MRKITIVFLLAAVALTALPRPVMAQNKAQVMAMAQAELQKRGLDEAEVRARLLENGIDVDNIPPQEYAAYQGRITAILNQMQAEKTGANATAEGGEVAGTTVVPAGRWLRIRPNFPPRPPRRAWPSPRRTARM